MNIKPIIIVAGEPNSIFFEIFFKSINNNKFKCPIILIGSKKLLELQLKYYKQKILLNELNFNKIDKNTIYKKLNIINVEYAQKIPFKKISEKYKDYISKCFDIGIKLI